MLHLDLRASKVERAYIAIKINWQVTPEQRARVSIDALLAAADQLKGIIQQLCVCRWLATSELAALVDRDAEKLQSRFLTTMVREGALELRYPDVRNRTVPK